MQTEKYHARKNYSRIMCVCVQKNRFGISSLGVVNIWSYSRALYKLQKCLLSFLVNNSKFLMAKKWGAGGIFTGNIDLSGFLYTASRIWHGLDGTSSLWSFSIVVFVVELCLRSYNNSWPHRARQGTAMLFRHGRIKLRVRSSTKLTRTNAYAHVKYTYDA